MTVYWNVLDDDGEVVSVTDLHVFFAWERTNHGQRLIGFDQIADDVHVSTILLASTNRPELPFETMVFGGAYNLDKWRWGSRKEADAGHQAIVAAVRDGTRPNLGYGRNTDGPR